MFDPVFANGSTDGPPLWFCAAVFTCPVLAIGIVIFGYNWLMFTASWHLFGYRPKFYDDDTMAAVAERFTKRAVSATMKICPNSVLSPEDREEASATSHRMFCAAFKHYVNFFCLRTTE